LSATCVNDAVLPRAAIATVRLLERLGVAVDFPEQHSCCGQPQFNTGYRQLTEPRVRWTARVFDGCDYVATPSDSRVTRGGLPR
jgi:L-lactate dehydrogenase complex protein LldE